MLQTSSSARKRLRDFSSLKNAQVAKWFFKTDDGCYGAHDRFIGVKVPDTRLVAKEFRELPLTELQSLLSSKIHEERLLALIILVNRSKKAEPSGLKKLTAFYLKNRKHVNNWDLVDVSAEHLLGAFLFAKSPAKTDSLLLKLARSKDLWERRISIIATFYFIRRKSFVPTFQIADILLLDEEDLIHKAVGWMLREAGNRDHPAEVKFLARRYHKMPRTMLRYAIEKFPEKLRKQYLNGAL
jgi:3-methyladenine DNA glycosylase AlkD